MQSEDQLEREVFDHFKRQYIQSAEDRAEDEIYWLMVEHKYGPGARDPMQPVDWDRVFGENRCPECDDVISLGVNYYSCGKCGLNIPLQLFDKALEEFRRRVKIRAEDEELSERMRSAGYDRHRISMIYKAASEQALDELKTKRRRQEMESARSDGKSGASLGRGVR